MWLDNYRNLQRSRMPPFGYSSLLSSVNPSSINITTNQGQFPAASPGVAPAVHQAPASTTNFNSLSPLYSTISSGQTDKSFNPGSHVAIVFAKIYELLASRDTNGPRLLAIITEELLNLPNLLVSRHAVDNLSLFFKSSDSDMHLPSTLFTTQKGKCPPMA